ncbi:MAG: hypothetical protein IJ083_14090 [Clostridia bacterium]|nr:hypothetical protein [Clostridia bacterium]
MAAPTDNLGPIRTIHVHRKRPNGDVYVYEQDIRYDPDRHFNRTIQSRLLGKIPAGSDEMVPTRTRNRAGKTVDLLAALETAAGELGLSWNDLRHLSDQKAREVAALFLARI